MTTIREQLEKLEDETLTPRATRSAGAARQYPDESSEMRTEFQRDRDRIIHTKSFRRLMHKTQVFIAPQGDHYRTRLTHTLEVTQIARTIGRALRLNEDLIEAIGMGHDLGHTPFGHAGESALAEVFPGFRHNEQSLRVVEYLENDGRGLNLTEPVRNGILRHSKGRASILTSHALDPETLEGEVLKLSDGIAYMNHDLDDAIRAEIVDESDVPAEIQRVLGTRHSQRINTLVTDVITHSDVTSPDGHISMSAPVREAADVLRDFLYERVYEPINLLEETRHKQEIVRNLFQWFTEFPEDMPEQYLLNPHDEPLERRVTDYVASMTDRFAIDIWDSLFGEIDQFSIAALEEEESNWTDG